MPASSIPSPDGPSPDGPSPDVLSPDVLSPDALADGSVVLRRATLGDADALAQVAARLFRETYAPPAGTSRPEDVAAYVALSFTPGRQRAELEDDALRTLLAEAGGRLVGYLQLRHDSTPGSSPDFAWLADAGIPDTDPARMPLAVPGARGARAETPGDDARWAELARLYVDRAWHGRGVARALLGAGCTLAAAAGARRLWLATYRANARAVAFYRREGFRPVATASFQMGAERQADWIMARALPPGP